MSNAPLPFKCDTPTLPPTSPNKNTEPPSTSLPPQPGNLDVILCDSLDVSKYTTNIVGAADYVKAVDNAFETLRLPAAVSPPPEVLRRMYTRSLRQKNAVAMCLADAERKCQDWEGALCHVLGDAEVRKISEENTVIDVDEADTVRGQYITAITGIRMQDFCLSKRCG